MTTVGTISDILRFPVKSLKGETLDECEITSAGLAGDRALALLDVETGKIASAKQPNLWRALLCFTASTEGSRKIVVSDKTGRCYGNIEEVVDAEISKTVNRKVKLIKTRPVGLDLNRARPDEVMSQGEASDVTQDLLVIAAKSPDGGFFDYAPIHFITSSSLEATIDAAPEAAIAAERYRPNLIIDSPGYAPFSENDWIGKRLQIGDSVELEVIARTPRCAVPMLAQGDLPRSPEAVGNVARLNSVENPVFGEGLFACLGAYAVVRMVGTVKLGDTVRLA